MEPPPRDHTVEHSQRHSNSKPLRPHMLGQSPHPWHLRDLTLWDKILHTVQIPQTLEKKKIAYKFQDHIPWTHIPKELRCHVQEGTEPVNVCTLTAWYMRSPKCHTPTLGTLQVISFTGIATTKHPRDFTPWTRTSIVQIHHTPDLHIPPETL